MIGLGAITKLMRGGLGPDELGEMLAAAGIESEFAPVPVDQALAAFQEAGAAASLPSSRILRLVATMKGGEQIHALIIVNQKD